MPPQDDSHKSKNQKKLDKYSEDMNNFSVAGNTNIKDGCVAERKCTDLLCLGVFLGFLGAMMGCTIWGLKNGDFTRYVAPFDGAGLICGSDPAVADYPNLYLTDLLATTGSIFDSGVCVKTCPTKEHRAIDCNTDDTPICQSNSVVSSIYSTHEVLGYCIPDISDLKKQDPNMYEAWKIAFKQLTNNPAGRKLQDLYLSSRAIYASMALSLVYCILFIYLMSAFAEYIAWACIGLTQIGLFIGSGVAFQQYFASKSDLSGQTLTENQKNEQTLMLILGIVFGLFAVIFLILIWCGFNQLRIAINVIDASADFIAKTKRIIAVPVLYFFVTAIMILIWATSMGAIYSVGDIKANTNQDLIPQRKEITLPDGLKEKVGWISLFMLFGLLWICAFLRAKSSFIVMVSATSYYFDSNKERDGYADVGLGFKYTYLFHIGSIALGSFIIAVVQMIRLIFLVLAEQAKRASGENAAVKVIICVADCLLKCIEKICDYIQESAYAYMAISGDSFCTSAWNGFLLQLKHAMKFSWANFLANMFIFIGKVAIVCINLFSLYMIMKFVTKDLDEITSVAAPFAVVGIVTYISASTFLGLFDEVVLAMMNCLAIDTDLNGTPIYGPPTFHDAFDSEPEAPKNAIADGGWEKNQNNTMA